MKLPLVLIAEFGPICINDAAGRTIVDNLTDSATGAAIVTAVNAHADLLAALSSLVTDAELFAPHLQNKAVLANARAAVRKATS